MPALNFKKQFIPHVLSEDKPGTVRQVRLEGEIKTGQTVSIYSGMRTRQCKKYGTKEDVRVYPIALDLKNRKVTLDGVELVFIIQNWFTTIDICGSEDDFWQFFTAQNYQRPLVWIVWHKETIAMIDQYLHYMKIYNKLQENRPALFLKSEEKYVHDQPMMGMSY